MYLFIAASANKSDFIKVAPLVFTKKDFIEVKFVHCLQCFHSTICESLAGNKLPTKIMFLVNPDQRYVCFAQRRLASAFLRLFFWKSRLCCIPESDINSKEWVSVIGWHGDAGVNGSGRLLQQLRWNNALCKSTPAAEFPWVNCQWFIVSYDSANKQKHHKNHRMH